MILAQSEWSPPKKMPSDCARPAQPRRRGQRLDALLDWAAALFVEKARRAGAGEAIAGSTDASAIVPGVSRLFGNMLRKR